MQGHRKLLLLVLLGALLLCSSAIAQETWGTVRGTVVDPTGAAVPNANVELSGGALPRALAQKTGVNGSYMFAQVPAGTGYQVVVTGAGFANARVAGVNVELGKATAMEIKLELGQVSQTVEVSASSIMVDTASSSSAVTVDKSFFDLLPKGRSFSDLIAIAPGARNETKAGGYEIDGASGSESTYFLDGMDVTSVQSGTLSSQNKLPVEMVQQVQIKNGAMEAQYGGAMGGVVNAVIRSGNNQVHGDAGFYFDNDAMSARLRPLLRLDPADDSKYYYNQPLLDSYRTWNPIFNIGGPLIKNKLFFFTGYAPRRTNTDRHMLFNTGETGDYNRVTTQQYLANKLDFDPTEKIRINMSWLWNPTKNTGGLPATDGTGSFSTDYKILGNRTAGNVLSGQVDYLATSKLIFSFRGGYSYTNYNTNYGVPSTTAIYTTSNSTFTGLPAGLSGLKSGWYQQAVALTAFDQYTRTNLGASISYLANWAGQHDLKAGWQANYLANSVLSSSYPNGYYRYYWGSTYYCQFSGCSGKGAYGYYRYRVYGDFGDVSSNNQALYIQDNWRVNRRLTLNLGLRTEHEFVPSFAVGNNIPSDAITFSWGQKLAPRIGGAFDITGTGKQKIYASFGLFFDIMKYELPRGSFGGAVYKDYYYTFDDPSWFLANQGLASDPTKLKGNLIETADWRPIANDPNKKLIDPNIKPMQQRTLDVGYDYGISSTLVASARYTHRSLVRTIEDTGFLTASGEDYYIGNPSEGVLGDAKIWASHWPTGVPLPPKPERNYDALEVRLDKRFSSKYQFSASYTLSRLYGNYSGLASSDEDNYHDGTGRTSPNTNRYYDEPWVGVMQTGQYAYGRLATDRPHSFKLFGAYTLTSKLGNTTFSPNSSWYSGTPVTTSAAFVTTTPGFPFGRGDMGRTPVFFNTDFNVTHEFKPLGSKENVKAKIEFAVFNLFNNSTVTDYYKDLVHENDGQLQFLNAAGDPDYAAIFKGFDTKKMMAAQGIRVDPRYGKAQTFQDGRWARLQASFSF